MTIGEKIRLFGEKKYSSVRDFAHAMGMSPPALQNYLSGRREPGTPVLKKLQSLGCDLNWLLSETEGGQGPPVKRDNEKEELEAENRALKEELAKVRTFIRGAAVLLPKVEALSAKKRRKR